MRSDQNQVVILGAGYGGLRTALRLEPLLRQNPYWRILLVDRFNYHQLKTEIHEVAAGRISPEEAAISIPALIRGRRIEFLQAEVTGINFDEWTLKTSQGKIQYNILVIALGSETEFYNIPGLTQCAFTLSSVEDGVHIKEHIRSMFAQARAETHEAKKKAMLTVVLGGAGFTGVELATELSDYLRKLSRQFNIRPDQARLIVIEALDSILPGFEMDLIKQAQKIMKSRGIDLRLNTPLVSAESSSVTLGTGEEVRTHTIIWTGGIRASSTVARSGLTRGAGSRIAVNPYLESVDFQRAYLVGDVALVLDSATNTPLAPTAQLALQQADVAAQNILADIKHLRRVKYVPKVVGQFVSLGGKNAVGWVWKFRVTGFLAWFLKRVAFLRYLYSIGGLQLVLKMWRTFFT